MLVNEHLEALPAEPEGPLVRTEPGSARPELAGVLVECKDGSLRVVASDSYRLAVRDIVPESPVTVPSDWAGPEVEILLNAGFVAEALAAHVGPDVPIDVVEPLRPVTFRSADTGTFSVLLMPVRPRDEDAEAAA